MQIRCYHCGMNFTLRKEEALFVLEALEESGSTHYDARCTRCRHANRISLEQLRRIAPSPQPEDQSEEEG